MISELVQQGNQSLLERSESDLVALADREYEMGCRLAHEAVGHWVAAGDALLALRGKLGMATDGRFASWIDENLAIPRDRAQRCMRMGFYRDVLEKAKPATLHGAQEVLVGLPAIGGRANQGNYDNLKSSAETLRSHGLKYSEIGEALGVSQSAVYEWINPEAAERRNASWREARRNAREKKQAREEARVSRLIRQRGGSVAEAYSLIRKAAQELDRAHSEASDAQVMAELRRALGRVHSAEDDVVRALGIA